MRHLTSFILDRTLSETFLRRVDRDPQKVAFEYRPFHEELGKQAWRSVTFIQFFEEVRLVSLGLRSAGAQSGQTIGLVSETRYKWNVCDLAILGAGGISVPLSAEASSDSLFSMLEMTNCSMVIVENQVQFDKLLEAIPALPKTNIKRVISIDPIHRHQETIEVIDLNDLIERGREIRETHLDNFQSVLESCEPDDVFTICFTSGTTSKPKPIRLTHRNLMTMFQNLVTTIGQFISGDDQILSVLPSSHILGRIESLGVYPLGWRQIFSESPNQVLANLKEKKPTLMVTAPLLFTDLFEKFLDRIEKGSSLKRLLTRTALDFSKRIEDPQLSRRLRPLLFQSLRKELGGRLRTVICGGAQLDTKIEEFFSLLGIPILQGYGLTETCGLVAINSPIHFKSGSIGQAFPEVHLRLSDQGEIQVRSQQISPDALPASSSGFLNTGDLARRDQDGFLFLSERKQSVLKTAEGLQVSPEQIEARLPNASLIRHLVVVGADRQYLSALITLREEDTIKFAQENHILFSRFSELARHDKIRQQIQTNIDEINLPLQVTERIRRFEILPSAFSVQGGELTPALELRRQAIQQKFRPQIDALYQNLN